MRAKGRHPQRHHLAVGTLEHIATKGHSHAPGESDDERGDMVNHVAWNDQTRIYLSSFYISKVLGEVSSTTTSDKSW